MSRKPVTINGVEYPSVAEAANQYGIKATAANARIRAGWSLEDAFLTPAQKGRCGIEICINGVQYPSISAAARECGVEPHIVFSRVRKGWNLEDAILTPVTKSESHKKGNSHGIGICINGVQYPSISAAARKYGISPNTVRVRVKKGMPLENAILTPVRKLGFKRQVELRGVKCSTITEAAKISGINHMTVRSRLLGGWSLEDAVFTPLHSNDPKPLIIKGVEYPSINAAAKKYGIKPSIASSRLRYGWSPEDAILTPSRGKDGKTVKINGVKYSSIKECAEKYGINPQTVLSRLRYGWSLESAILTPPRKWTPKSSGEEGEDSLPKEH